MLASISLDASVYVHMYTLVYILYACMYLLYIL